MPSWIWKTSRCWKLPPNLDATDSRTMWIEYTKKVKKPHHVQGTCDLRADDEKGPFEIHTISDYTQYGLEETPQNFK